MHLSEEAENRPESGLITGESGCRRQPLTEPMYIEKYDENDQKRNCPLPPHSNAL